AIPAAAPVAPTASGPALPATRPPPLGPPHLAKPSGGQVPKALLQLRRRSYKLWPVAGAGLATRRPVLHRARGPEGPGAYNIEIWQYPGLKRVLSAYPSGTTLKVRAGVLEPGRRYVWRAWPYMRGARYAPAPVGVSFFQIVPRAGRGPPPATDARHGAARSSSRWPPRASWPAPGPSPGGLPGPPPCPPPAPPQ